MILFLTALLLVSIISATSGNNNFTPPSGYNGRTVLYLRAIRKILTLKLCGLLLLSVFL